MSKAVVIGQRIEQEALIFLQKKGLKLIQSNFRCKGGEIDLIMYDGTYVVFIEVRFRKSTTYGSPLETVNFSKQKRILHAAQLYLLLNRRFARYACRFDVLSVRPEKQFEWIQNAFQGY